MRNKSDVSGVCKTPYIQNTVGQYRQYHKQGALEPSVLSEVFSSIALLRATSSASVPRVDMSILYNGRWRSRVLQLPKVTFN